MFQAIFLGIFLTKSAIKVHLQIKVSEFEATNSISCKLMPRICEHDLRIEGNTVLICYKIPHSVTLVHASSQQQLRKYIDDSEGKCQVRVLCDLAAERQALQSKKSQGQTASLESARLVPKQQDLLEQIADDSQNYALEKANALLESMIKKTQYKILETTRQWTLKKIEQDIQKCKEIVDKNNEKTSSSKPMDKKQRKSRKSAQKKLQELMVKKDELLNGLLEGSAGNGHESEKLRQQLQPAEQLEDESPLLGSGTNFSS